MRVVVDSTFLRRAPLSGTGIYIERICDELERIGVEVVRLANPRRGLPGGGRLQSARNLASDHWWTGVELPRRARRVGADVVHVPLAPIAPRPRIPQVVTIYDLSFVRMPEAFDRSYRVYASWTHRAAARSASAVVAISETTATDIVELWGVPRERIVVAHLGPGQDLPAVPAGPRWYFLYVGDAEPRKDLPTLLAAYAEYRAGAQDPIELVLAGSARAQAPGVRSESGLTAVRLAGLYSGAVALVHTSLYEGFGLTTLEAMKLGTPVIAARSPGVVEMCGDAARYAEPRDPASFAAAMAEVAGSSRLQTELAQAGRRRVAGFSWVACARAHMGAYSLAMGDA